MLNAGVTEALRPICRRTRMSISLLFLPFFDLFSEISAGRWDRDASPLLNSAPVNCNTTSGTPVIGSNSNPSFDC